MELINGRTAEEIKRRLKCTSFDYSDVDCDDCEYSDLCESVDASGDAANAIAYIEHLEAKIPKWISVEERLPNTTDVYLVHMVHRYNKNDGYRCMDVRLFFKGEFAPWQGLPDIYEVTHWMPLPELPKEGAE